MEQPTDRDWPGRGKNKVKLYNRRLIARHKVKQEAERQEDEFEVQEWRMPRRWRRHSEEMQRMVAGDGSRL